MRFLLVLCLFASGGAIVGCHVAGSAQASGSSVPLTSADPPATASSAPIADPCSLLTVDEVSEVMGRKANPGELHKAFNGSRCNFYDQTSQYEIFLQTVDWNIAGQMMTSDNALQGIGDKAYWSFGSIYVLKNGHGMMIGFQLPDVLPKSTPQVEKLARTAAGRM
jgi:hypothetical protein